MVESENGQGLRQKGVSVELDYKRGLEMLKIFVVFNRVVDLVACDGCKEAGV